MPTSIIGRFGKYKHDEVIKEMTDIQIDILDRLGAKTIHHRL